MNKYGKTFKGGRPVLGMYESLKTLDSFQLEEKNGGGERQIRPTEYSTK